MAIFILSRELLKLGVPDPFALPSLPRFVVLVVIATFIWSYMVSAGTAWALPGVERVPAAHALIGGGLSSVLLLLLAGMLGQWDTVPAIVAMLAGMTAFPALIVLAVWWLARPNNSLERTREG